MFRERSARRVPGCPAPRSMPGARQAWQCRPICRPWRAAGGCRSAPGHGRARDCGPPIPTPHHAALAGRHQPGLDLFAAQGADQLGEWDLDRAHALAAAIEGAGVGQVVVFGEAVEERREDRAHRTGIDPAIGVTADRAVHRAVVHAGATADAAQHLAELAAEHFRAAVVDQHDVVFLGPSGSPGRRGPVDSVV